jgi:hypothetical protein
MLVGFIVLLDFVDKIADPLTANIIKEMKQRRAYLVRVNRLITYS